MGKWSRPVGLRSGARVRVALWIAVGAAVFLLVIAIIGFSVASGRGARIEELEGELADVRRDLSRSPDAKELEAAAQELETARRDLDAARRDTESWKVKAGAASSARSDLSARSDEILRKLEAAEEEKLETATRLAESLERAAELEQELKGTTALLAKEREVTHRADESLVDAQKLTAGMQAQHEEELRQLLARQAEANDAHTRDVAALKQQLAAGEELTAKLKADLAQFPPRPLPESLAEKKYHEILNEVAKHEERDARVDLFFRGKLILAGTRYEPKIAALWRDEAAQKQADVDRAAKAVYGNVTSKTRLHPKEHDENVKLLTEALEKARGSRYEAKIQKLIDRQHELKAAGK